jgi:iron complex outermembrane receptor protein
MRYAFIKSNGLLLLPIAIAGFVAADQSDNINEITIQAYPPVSQISAVSDQQLLPATDAATVLADIPGANFNSNGPITGIAQYRGLFGDRVSISLDNSPALTGGPNAMDTPLAYAPPSLLKELAVHRGITPVSAAQESLGGHVIVQFDRGDFTDSASAAVSGFANSQYGDNGYQSSNNIQWIAANNQHKAGLLASHDKGDSIEAADNLSIGGTQYQRDRFDLSYGWQSQTTNAEIYLGHLDIDNTGTPALAMDIISVASDLAGFNLTTELDRAKLSVVLGWADVVHSMDNHSLRLAPAMTMNYRHNQAEADNLSWAVKAAIPVNLGDKGSSTLTLGTDGNFSDHQSVITNPENAVFNLLNFNQVERDSVGLFAQYNSHASEGWNYQAGIRHNQISLRAGQVGAAGMMGMMASNANMLAVAFNNSDRDISHHNTDLVLKLSRGLNANTSVNIDLGVKNRAPSYQETFLWMPLPITAGLADGRSYLGNPNLDSETATEINIALNLNGGSFSFAPQLFYRHIDDYIQGTAATNVTANRVSTMMSGAPALMHSNVDAKIYGVDADWHYRINQSWSLEGLLSYVRGKRTDISDNLYRIAPPNSSLSLHYQPSSQAGKLRLSIQSQLYARQTDTAVFNNEQPSASYGLINISGLWAVTSNLQFYGGIDNLFDRSYSNHLSGRNRAMGIDIPVGTGLPGLGRQLYVAMQLNW